jgi:hypothetical protein
MRRLPLVLVLALAACGRDFDSLFFDAGTPNGDASSAPDVVTTTDASVDANDAASTCPPSCVNQSACDKDSGTCTTQCSGCCDCGMQTCPASDGNKRCEAQCTAGAICNVACLLAGPCTMTCGIGSQCLFTCGPSAASCELSCADGSKKDCGGGKFVCGRQCP